MKKLQVLRVDNDLVQKIDLQIGNNVIGRSVLIGCDDERVINQAVTINVAPDNEMTITPVSPCYMKSTESSTWKLLKLGTTVPIKPGYICSLVPDKCCFKIISTSDKVENNEEYTLKRKAKKDLDSHIPDKRVRSGEGDNVESSGDTLIKILNNNTTTADRDKNYINEVNSLCGTIDNKMNDSSSKIMCQSQNIDETCLLNEDACQIPNPIQTSSKPVVCGEASNFETNSNLPAASKNNNNVVRGDMQAVSSTKPNESNVSTNSKQNFRRKKCKYAEKCYRRSLEHKAKYSHCNDSDYDIPDERKECPYGKQCYRKNPEHKMQYKHTTNRNIANKQNKNRRKTKVQKPSDTLSELEDSSAEESVEESVDESEYEPTSDTDSSDEDEMYSDKNESD